jgi:hypothetical protein
VIAKLAVINLRFIGGEKWLSQDDLATPCNMQNALT